MDQQDSSKTAAAFEFAALYNGYVATMLDQPGDMTTGAKHTQRDANNAIAQSVKKVQLC